MRPLSEMKASDDMNSTDLETPLLIWDGVLLPDSTRATCSASFLLFFPCLHFLAFSQCSRGSTEMNLQRFTLLISFIQLYFTAANGHGIHLPLYRRGGRFLRRDAANLTYLGEIMHQVEARYSRTHRQIEGNHLVRQWRVKEQEAEDENDENLIDVAGYDNRW